MLGWCWANPVSSQPVRADANFIDYNLVFNYSIRSTPLSNPINIHSLNDLQLHEVCCRTIELALLIDNHSENLFHFLWSSLSTTRSSWGLPGSTNITPMLIDQWEEFWDGVPPAWGNASNLPRAPPPANHLKPRSSHISKVPEVYVDLKEKATFLPPHQPYRPFAWHNIAQRDLFLPEHEAMSKYISDSLKAGLIRPSSFPVAADFFFVGNIDGTPCPWLSEA